MKAKIECTKEHNWFIDVLHYSPERPAPDRKNPNDPVYTDAGDPEEMEYDLYLVFEKNVWDEESKMHKPAKIKVLMDIDNDEFNRIFDQEVREYFDGKWKIRNPLED
jgi:hypothetical protein